jgi:hypothetical protein
LRKKILVFLIIICFIPPLQGLADKKSIKELPPKFRKWLLEGSSGDFFLPTPLAVAIVLTPDGTVEVEVAFNPCADASRREWGVFLRAFLTPFC